MALIPAADAIRAALVPSGSAFSGAGADSIFSQTTTLGTAYNGDYGDLAFTLGVFLMTFGLLGFNRLKNVGEGKVA